MASRSVVDLLHRGGFTPLEQGNTVSVPETTTAHVSGQHGSSVAKPAPQPGDGALDHEIGGRLRKDALGLPDNTVDGGGIGEPRDRQRALILPVLVSFSGERDDFSRRSAGSSWSREVHRASGPTHARGGVTKARRLRHPENASLQGLSHARALTDHNAHHLLEVALGRLVAQQPERPSRVRSLGSGGVMVVVPGCLPE